MSFRAFVVNQDRYRIHRGRSRNSTNHHSLPGEVTIRVAWSSVNYKDGLALSPAGRVVTSFPMTPGVDLAGTVVSSQDSRFAAGDEVMVTGWDTGTGHAGGFAELARMPAAWVMPIPAGLTAKEAMAIGTAGLTAALSIEQLERNGLKPANGTVIVTGATGGVGSTAVSMLAMLGYTVAGSTGKESEHAFLRGLGATEVLSREEVSAESNPATGARTLGRRHRSGGWRDHRLPRAHDEVWWLSRGVRAHGWKRRRHQCLPVHPARREPARYRLRPDTDGDSAARLAAARDRPKAARLDGFHRR